MLIKQAQKGELRHLISLIQSAIKSNRKLITFPKKKFKYLLILKILYEFGYIQNFEERGDFLIIRLKQIFWQTEKRPTQSIHYINTYARVTRRYSIKMRKIQKIQKNSGDSVLRIFTTDLGIATGHQALRQFCGGMPLILIK